MDKRGQTWTNVLYHEWRTRLVSSRWNSTLSVKKEIPRRWARTHKYDTDCDASGGRSWRGQSRDYHNVTGNVPFPLWFPSAAPAAPVHMGADKNVLSLTVTRYTFVHKHIPTEKVVAWPNYIIHDYVCGILSSERHILPDRENFFLMNLYTLWKVRIRDVKTFRYF